MSIYRVIYQVHSFRIHAEPPNKRFLNLLVYRDEAVEGLNSWLAVAKNPTPIRVVYLLVDYGHVLEQLAKICGIIRKPGRPVCSPNQIRLVRLLQIPQHVKIGFVWRQLAEIVNCFCNASDLMMKAALTRLWPLQGDYDEVIAILKIPHRFNRIPLGAADHPQHRPNKNQWLLFFELGNE